MTNEQRQKRVLYAEASDLVQASHGLALQSLNCYVVQVASAAAALEALSSEEPFDIILVGDVSKSSQGEAPEPVCHLVLVWLGYARTRPGRERAG